jgi:hypothetical protein
MAIKEVEVNSTEEFVDELLDDLPEVDPEDLPKVSTATYQVWLLGYNFNTEGDIEVDDFAQFIGECESKAEAKQLAISFSNTRLELDTNSDVVMIQVQTVVEVEDHGEVCVGVDYERQIEFIKKENK